MTPHIFGLICAAAVLLFVFRRELMDWPRRRTQQARSKEAFQAWQAANPPGPPLTPDEEAEFKVWIEAGRLHAALLVPTGETTPGVGGTRFGGPVWLDDAPWPVDPYGDPMEFIGQLDFAELPPLADFPDNGLLQFFVTGDLNAGNTEPGSGDVALIWHPEVDPNGALTTPAPFYPETRSTPFCNEAVRLGGVALTASAASMPPTAEDWTVTERLGWRDPGDLDDYLMTAGGHFANRHHVGGYPALVQGDFRSGERLGDYDRVLLKLTSDKIFQWSDCGEAAFLIPRQDLLARDFSRVIFYFESS